MRENQATIYLKKLVVTARNCVISVLCQRNDKKYTYPFNKNLTLINSKTSRETIEAQIPHHQGLKRNEDKDKTDLTCWAEEAKTNSQINKKKQKTETTQIKNFV